MFEMFVYTSDGVKGGEVTFDVAHGATGASLSADDGRNKAVVWMDSREGSRFAAALSAFALNQRDGVDLDRIVYDEDTTNEYGGQLRLTRASKSGDLLEMTVGDLVKGFEVTVLLDAAAAGRLALHVGSFVSTH